MKLKYNQFAFITLVIFVFLLSIIAASATPLRGKEISECSCLIISNPIEIRNTGSSVDGYYITQSGKAAEWSEVLPDIVILEPGETIVVDNFINIPCDSKSTSKLYTTIKSLSSTEHFKQEINVIDCYNLHQTNKSWEISTLVSFFKISLVILLIILFIFFIFYLLSGPTERLFYRSVNIKRPKQKKKRKRNKEKRVKRKKIFNPSSKKLLFKIFSLIILILLAFIVFKGIQYVISENNQTIEMVEEIDVQEIEEIMSVEEPIEIQEESQENKLNIVDFMIYLMYSAIGFVILLLLLFVLIRLKDRPKTSGKRSLLDGVQKQNISNKTNKKKNVKSNKLKKTNCRKSIAKFWKCCTAKWKQIFIVFLIVIVVIFLYLFRGIISIYLASLKDYVLIYLTYIIIGFLLLGMMIFVFSKLNR